MRKAEMAVYRSPGEDSRLRFPERATPWAQGALFAACMHWDAGYSISGAFLCWVLFLLTHSAGSSRHGASRLFAGTTAEPLLFYWIAYTVAVPGKLGWPWAAWPRYSFPLRGDLFSAAGFFFSPDRSSGPPAIAFPAVWTGLSTRDRSCCPGPWVLQVHRRSTFLMQAAVPGEFSASVLRPRRCPPVPVVSFFRKTPPCDVPRGRRCRHISFSSSYGSCG